MTTLTKALNELNRIYGILNAKYFDDELPEVFITIYPGKTKARTSYGSFTPEAWAKVDNITTDNEGNEVIEKSDIHHEITMSAEYFTRPTSNWVATLVHEMVHLYCHINEIEDTSNNGRYHNKRFKVEAEKRGLIIEKADIIGWSVTSPNADLIHFVSTMDIDEEAFRYFRDTKFGPTKGAVKKRYVCPLCGLQVQAKKDKLIICGDCDKTMDYWNLTDPDNPECIQDMNNGLAMTGEGWYGMEFGTDDNLN